MLARPGSTDTGEQDLEKFLSFYFRRQTIDYKQNMYLGQISAMGK